MGSYTHTHLHTLILLSILRKTLLPSIVNSTPKSFLTAVEKCTGGILLPSPTEIVLSPAHSGEECLLCPVVFQLSSPHCSSSLGPLLPCMTTGTQQEGHCPTALYDPLPELPAVMHFRVSNLSQCHPCQCVINTSTSKIRCLEVNKWWWILNTSQITFYWKDHLGWGCIWEGLVVKGLCTCKRGAPTQTCCSFKVIYSLSNVTHTHTHMCVHSSGIS